MSLKPDIRPYSLHPLECRDYDPAAVEVVRLVAERILATLPMVAVEHIGSTAVPGCPGKGIVDLAVIYPDGCLEPTKTVLGMLGFQRQFSGHQFPESRPMRVGAVEYEGETYRLHVHVVVESSPEVVQLRWFRDRLRADGDLCAAYAARKREILSSGVLDPAVYTQMKASFIRGVLEHRPDSPPAPRTRGRR